VWRFLIREKFRDAAGPHVALPGNGKAPGRCWSPQEAAPRSLALNPITFFHGGYYA